jgi:outer membrane protein OmpA-like peptidoglycan-associated protein/tetratricopeptide (TPR) repeat protein
MSFAQDKKALIYFEKGKKDFMERKYESATENFEKYLERDTSRTEAYFRLGQISESFRDVNKASEYYKKVINRDSLSQVPFVQAYMFLGSRAIENHDFEAAKAYLTVSMANTNKNSIVYKQLEKQVKTIDFGMQALGNPMNIKPEPLPEIINTKAKQYFPVLTADNTTLIFTAVENEGDENIFKSELKDGQWQQPVSISNEINSPFNEGTCSITTDGKIMVFTSCEGRDSFGSCDLYITKKQGDKWSKPENLGPNINSNFWDSQPSLSSDGSKLFFASERPGGLGKKDIWMSVQDANGRWTKAVNMGKNINTYQDEVSPFIHANGYSLFFASNGKVGMGNLDLYLTNLKNMQADSAINLGYPINTADDELSLFITADGKSAYYSVNKSDKVNLYKFSIPEVLSKKFNKTYFIKGFVLDQKTNKPVQASIELVNVKTKEKLSRFLSDAITGDYLATLPGEGQYVLYVESDGYLFKSLNFDFSKAYESKTLNIPMVKIEKETVEVLQNIFFDSGSAILREESYLELDKLTELLAKNPKLNVEISGHTDDVGNIQTNQDLSLKRAQSVVKYLENKGLSTQKFITKGFGESKPKVKNDSDENRQINRRIEMRFL